MIAYKSVFAERRITEIVIMSEFDV